MLRKFFLAIGAAALCAVSVECADAQTINPPPNPAGSGTVTSVGITPPAIMTAGAPVTTNGNISLTLNSQTANQVFAAPNGSAGTPTFRALVTADFPSTLVGSQTANFVYAAPNGSAGAPAFRALVGADLAVTQAGTGGVARTYASKSADILGTGDYSTAAQAITQGIAAAVPVTSAPTLYTGSTCGGDAAISSGTYTTATGAVTLTLAASQPGLTVGQDVYVGGLTGTGSFASLNGRYTTTAGSTGTTLNYTAATGLGAVTITGGTVIIPSGFTCTGGNARAGFHLGNLAIGDQTAGVNSFVNLYVDQLVQNASQEMRGVSVTKRYFRTTPDETLLGWDNIPGSFSNVVTAANNQNIIGNMKSVVAELHFFGPPASPYTVKNSYNVQATLVDLGTNITLQNWQGVIVSPTPTGGGTITNGYGIEIGNITATNPAAIKIDGTGTGGQIKWTNTAIYEDSGSKLNFDFGAQLMPVFLNPKVSNTASAGANGALPAQVGGYWSVIIGGVERKIPYYAP